MPLWKCYYHIIWATKYRQPIITPHHERIIYPAIRQKCYDLKGQVLEINGVADHIHVVLTIHPSKCLADVVKEMKGVSSYAVNHSLSLKEPFRWQGSYAVLTFGEKVIPDIIDYVAHQKQRHEQGATWAYLEELDNAE
ncbi:MAG: IS200/IS605 family transposase [bacterium]|nr:IS200/IS605 family transposase [bacterium]